MILSSALTFASRHGLSNRGRKLLLTASDQAAFSGSSFLLNIFLIHSLTGDAFGAFSLAYSVLILVSGLHNSLLLEPLGTIGPTISDDDPALYASALAIGHLLLSFIIGLVMAVIFWAIAPPPLANAGIAMAATAPILMLPWVVRRFSYVIFRPDIAAISSLAYLLLLPLLLALTYLLDGISPISAFLVMAAASAGSAVVGYWLLPVRLYTGDRNHFLTTARSIACAHWEIGRWVVLQTALSIGSSYIPMFVAAAAISVSAAGAIRATVIVLQPFQQISVAIATMLLLPILSRDYAHGRAPLANAKAQWLSLGLTAGAAVYLLMLVIFRAPIYDFFVSPVGTYSPWLVPLAGLVPVAGAIGAGHAIALRAARKTRFYPLSTGIPGLIAVFSAPYLTTTWGVYGAMLSSLITSASLSCLAVYLFRRWLQSDVPDKPG